MSERSVRRESKVDDCQNRKGVRWDDWCMFFQSTVVYLYSVQ